ncbi:MAG TPA: DNA primase [Alphaproteobacteria bacterium]|nr:DNA primase [Alphaproteobacteria bacterium]
MSFTPAFLEELRNRLPLSEIIGKRVKLTRAGREFKGCCPFHNEKTPSFYVNDDKQFFHCFGCGAHGDIIGFTMRHDRLSFPEAVESLCGQAGMQVPRDTPMDREKFDREKGLYQLLEQATAFFEEQLFKPAGKEALNYLHGRGLTDEAIRRFRLGCAPNDGQSLIKKLIGEKYKMEDIVAVGLAKKAEDRNEHYSFFRNRVIFPVGDRRGRVVAFGGRVLGDGEPKYLNSPDHPLFHKGKLLYGLSRARTAITQNQPLIVVEGYMDVIALVEAGYSGAVAPLGTALTEDQLTVLWKLLPPADARDPSRDYSPILCFDGDNAGLRAAVRALERTLPMLTATQTIRIATMAGAKDPDDLIRKAGKSAMDAILNQAKPMIEMIWETTLAGRQLRTPEERGAFMAALKQRVARIADETLRKLYHDDIQKRLSAAFAWSGSNNQNESRMSGGPRGNLRGKGSWQPPQAPAPLINRKSPSNPHRLREQALLALIINHPELFHDVGEELAQISFMATDCESLRQNVIDILSMHDGEPLDGETLYRHLSDGEHAHSLHDILCEATYLRVRFARPGHTLDDARRGWRSIWNSHLQERIHADLQSAKLIYKDNPSDENYNRLMALRAQNEQLMRTDGEDLSETG